MAYDIRLALAAFFLRMKVMQQGIMPGGHIARRFSKRICAALLALLLGLSPAMAVELGDGADDNIGNVPEYEDVADFLANHDADHQGAVKIGEHVFEQWIIDDFIGYENISRDDNGNSGYDDAAADILTDEKLVAVYDDVAAYLASAARNNTVFAIIGGGRFRVEELRELESDGNLSADNFPGPWELPVGTALGDYAQAMGWNATAVGENALAYSTRTVAVGRDALAAGTNSTALGDNAVTTTRNSIAAGHRTFVYGADSTAVGNNAMVFGKASMALGAGSSAARLEPYMSYYGTHPDLNQLDLVLCAEYEGGLDAFEYDCDYFITDEERSNPLLIAESDAGTVFREDIRQKARELLEGLEVRESLAVGNWAKASHDRATAVGVGAGAFGERSTAMGRSAEALGDRSTAIGDSAGALGEQSTAMGRSARALGNWSTAVGQWTHAADDNTTAIGAGAVAIGDETTVLGQSARAFGKWGTTALGHRSSVVRVKPGGSLDMRLGDRSVGAIRPMRPGPGIGNDSGGRG